MTQDQTRSFLAQCDPKALFQFYAKGTLLEDMMVRRGDAAERQIRLTRSLGRRPAAVAPCDPRQVPRVDLTARNCSDRSSPLLSQNGLIEVTQILDNMKGLIQDYEKEGPALQQDVRAFGGPDAPAEPRGCAIDPVLSPSAPLLRRWTSSPRR